MLQYTEKAKFYPHTHEQRKKEKREKQREIGVGEGWADGIDAVQRIQGYFGSQYKCNGAFYLHTTDKGSSRQLPTRSGGKI